jgi:hypothetical protein
VRVQLATLPIGLMHNAASDGDDDIW